MRALTRLLSANRPYSLRLVARGAYWLARTKLTRRPFLKYLDVALDYHCNMRCQHCFDTALTGGGETALTLEHYRVLAEQALALGCLHVNLQGGETLLVRDLPAHVAAFQPGRCLISITTNGFAFNESWARKLAGCGVRKIVFSMDSMDPSEHDSFRNLPGSHVKVMEAIALARRSGFAVTVNVTVSHESLASEGQRRLFSWLHQERIPYNPILACAVGNWRDRSGLLVEPEDAAYLEGLRAHGLAQRDLHASWVATGCPAVAEQLYITPHGDVMPCPFIHVSLGNLRRRSLTEIWSQAMAEGIHGHYNARCWIAEEESFARGIGALCEGCDSLPVSAETDAGRAFLARAWGAAHDRHPDLV